MTNFEKWKEELTIEDASRILGDLAIANDDCPFECPLYHEEIDGQPCCIYSDDCKMNLASFFSKNNETFEKWKKDLTVDRAGDILGDSMELINKCLSYCPAQQIDGHCAKLEDGYCNDVIHRYFMEEAE